jgi:hypothetical protein
MTSEQDGKATATPKLVRASQIVVTIVAFALLVSHVFKCGAVRVDGVTLALLGILLITPLVDLIRRVKWGDFEAEIGRAEWARKARSPLKSPHRRTENRAYEQRLRELLREDPRLALARVRMDLEESLRRLYMATVEANPDVRRMSLGKYVDGLVRANVLTVPMAGALRDVIGLANRAVHGEAVDPIAASDLAVAGARLIGEL